MQFVIYLLLALGGVAALLTRKREKLSSAIGCASSAAALVIAGVWHLSHIESVAQAAFLLPIVLVGIAASFHAPGYLAGHAHESTGRYWLFYNLTLAAMLAVYGERNFLRFIVAWELMGLFSFFLVLFECHERRVVRAAWIYLLACEMGGLLLVYVFARLHGAPGVPPALVFGLLAAAFGLKAGFPFLHVWLPEAHPAAPAPVSALMSGAMIPLGFLGFFRFFTIPAYGMVFLAIGVLGAFFGILSGLAQPNIKRLLAYSSFENIGIISIGFGLGLLGAEYHNALMYYAGTLGALIHVVSHALLKGSLFLGAGSVFAHTHTLNMDELGGLMKKMPLTGSAFALSSFGISGLPPFAGFAGELLIYTAAFNGLVEMSGVTALACFVTMIALALTGGCACAAFCKTLAAVFQGEPRSAHAADAAPETRMMSLAVLALALLALVIPFAVPFLPGIAGYEPLRQITGKYAVFAAITYLLLAIGLILRKRFARDGREVGTWDCGYAKPTARMEYTGSAFVQPSVDFFHGFLQEKKHVQKPEGVFLRRAELVLESEDFAMRVLWKRLFAWFTKASLWVHRFQSGYLHLYILIMVLALAAMLLWGYFAVPMGR